MKYPLFALLALAAVGALAACGEKTESAQPPTAQNAAPPASNTPMDGMNPTAAPAAKTAKGSGKVTAVDAAAGTITIDHDPIPEANWPAMTMGFKASSEQVASVKSGDKVAFDLKLEGGGGEITAITKQ